MLLEVTSAQKASEIAAHEGFVGSIHGSLNDNKAMEVESLNIPGGLRKGSVESCCRRALERACGLFSSPLGNPAQFPSIEFFMSGLLRNALLVLLS